MAAKPSPVASRSRKHKDGKGSLIELAIIVAVALGLAVGIQAFLVKPFRIPSPSMEPTLKVGQRVLVNRLGPHFRVPSTLLAPHFVDPGRGDVVVFKPPKGADDDRCGIAEEPESGIQGKPCE